MQLYPQTLSNIDSYSDDKLNIGHYREFLVSAPVVEMTKEQKWDIFQEMSKKNSVLTQVVFDNIKKLLRGKKP